MRQINYIIIHCSATKAGRDFHTKDIDKWHKERGWDGIGYHKVVTKDSVIHQQGQQRCVWLQLYLY